MIIPLNQISLVSGSLTLSQDVLGSSAYAIVNQAFNVPQNVVLSNCSTPVPPTANLLIVDATLESFLGMGQTPVTMYLFEVADLEGLTTREAIFIFNNMSALITSGGLLEAFGTAGAGSLPVELAALSVLSFSQQTLLLSTLDYTSPRYQNAPFPPLNDPSAPQTFLQTIQNDVTAGYVFCATAQLQQSTIFPVPPNAPAGTEAYTLDFETVLGTIGLTELLSSFSLNCQIQFASSGTLVNLLYPLKPVISPPNIPLSPALTQVGIGFPLGAGAPQIPIFELDGTLTFPAKPPKQPKPSLVRFSFEPILSLFSVMFTELPDIVDLEYNFGSGVLSSALGEFLPPGVIADLGLLELQEIGLSIDCSALTVTALSLIVTTEKPLSLFDGIEVQPALIANFVDPFEPYRTYRVEVGGKWFFKNSELDTVFVYTQGSTPDQDQALLFAQLALDSGINFVDLAAELFHSQVSGLPSLVLSDVEIMAQKMGSGDTAVKSVSLEIEVDSGWTLDGIELEIEDLTLNVTFQKDNTTASWEVQQASAQGTLEIGPAFFNLSAEYDASQKTWTYSGGTIPGESENLGAFLLAVTSALGIDPPADFLSPFNDVNVTGCYLQYQTSSSGSPSWQVTVSTDFQSGNDFNAIILDQVVLTLSRDGTGTSFSFDATTPSPQTQGIGSLTTYLTSALDITIDLPSSLTDTSVFLQGLSAAYNSATTSYNFVAYLNFASSAMVQLSIDVVSQTTGGSTYYLGGTILFNPGEPDEFEFKLDLVESNGVSDLVASLNAGVGKSINLSQLVQAIDPKASGINDFQIEVQDALFSHSTNPKKSLFAVDMGAQVNLSKLGSLPLIGHELASASSLDLAFQVIYATGQGYTAEELASINKMLGSPSFQFPEQTIQPGSVSVVTSMRSGGHEVIDMGIPVSASSTGSLSPTGGSASISTNDPNASNTGSNSGTTWFPLNKAFGPMYLNRVGLAFDKTTTTVEGYLDGAITIGPLSFEVLGLNVDVPLSGADQFIPSFGLQGLGLNYQSGPVNIGGTLFKQINNGSTEFDGFVNISTESLQIGAVGSFAQMNDGKDSLFVYAVLGEPLGGPAFFFVTGLAAGFGYNRALLPPAIGSVQNFPLITAAMAPAPQPQAGDLSGIRNYVAQQLELMQSDIVPKAGEYFLAAGVKFTSFKLVNGFLLAVVQFGDEFRIDLLGLANASLPPDDTTNPVAEAQLAILAHYVPSEGSIWVQGQLTPNSYILSTNCHLTGGFALACWNAGPYDGEFVVSIGGYASAFQVPSYYPNPPRVGFNWQVSSDLNVKGGGYFALVPHALMAGGSLNAVWQSGPVKAWFLMGADFLIEWKPFHYSADIYVDLGAELTIHFFGTHHISIDAGADINLWGPEFGGHARITVSVIGIHFHFSVDFGASSSEPPPLEWQEFQSSFLPDNTDQWLGVNIQDGLMRTVMGTLDDGSQAEVWIVKRDKLNITTSSVLPVTSAAFTLDGNPATTPPITPSTPGIAPMAVDAIDTSLHSITITRVTKKQQSTHHGVEASPPPPPSPPTEHLKLVANNKNIPSGMWGTQRKQPMNPAPGTDVLDSISGFSIVPTKESKDDPNPITVARSSLAYETTQQDGYLWGTDTGTFTGTTASSWTSISNILSTTSTARATALSNMGFGSDDESFNQSLDVDASILPQLGTLG